MCNCEKELKDKLLKEYRPDMESIDNPNEALGMDGKLIYYTPYEMKKTYETKTGKIRTKKETVNVFFKYCPYCGEVFD